MRYIATTNLQYISSKVRCASASSAHSDCNATQVMNWYIYEQAFTRFNMGYATALSMVLFLILIFVSMVQMRMMRAGESDM